MLAAQYDVHTGDFGDFLAFELGIATGNHHQGVGILADEVADVLPALAVGKSRHTTCIHHAHVGRLALGDRHDAMLGE